LKELSLMCGVMVDLIRWKMLICSDTMKLAVTGDLRDVYNVLLLSYEAMHDNRAYDVWTVQSIESFSASSFQQFIVV
jgi:hypothetical protein